MERTYPFWVNLHLRCARTAEPERLNLQTLCFEGEAHSCAPARASPSTGDSSRRVRATLSSMLKTLFSQGIFVRRADPHDRRRVLVALAPDASQALRRYFAEVAPVAVI